MVSPNDSDASFVVVDSSNEKERQHASCYPGYNPGSSTSYAHDWHGEHIRTHGRHFLDKYGRVVQLRGVNVSGCTKGPVNFDHSTFPSNPQEATFVGRPFPLEEAPEHFARLRRWGLTFIRFLVTWEAVEHEGPGIYDTDYLDYVHSLLSLLPQYGLVAFVAVHQDVWSRYSGGSGAPAWTLEAVGFDLGKLEDTHAAWLKGVTGGGHIESERGLWPTGYHKLAAATMNTLFWAGDTFAPKLLIETKNGKIPVQTFLQGSFLDMFTKLAQRLGGLEGVIGFEMMNEMHPGYITRPSLHGFDYNVDLHLGPIPSAFESFKLGAGYPTSVSVWTRSFPMPTSKSGSVLLNPKGEKVWRPDGPTQGKCIWAEHGVWGWDTVKNEGVVLRENYFSRHPMTGEKLDFYEDCFYPLLHKWASCVRSVSPPEKIAFVEVIPNEFCPPSFTGKKKLPNMVFAPHWYDLNGLFSKAFGNFSVNVQGLSRGMFPLKAFYWGQKGARENFSLQIRNIVDAGYKSLGEIPVIIGETGIPMDMNNKEAFTTDDFSWQAKMMDAVVTALESSLIGFTLWNYNPYNNDHEGDDWNGENFSWFSRGRALPPSLLDHDQETPTLDAGGRILSSVVRPYAAKTAGIPLRFQYEMTTGEFIYEWVNPSADATKNQRQNDASTTNPPLVGHPAITSQETEIYIPSLHTAGRKVVVVGLGPKDRYYHDEGRQTLFIVTSDRQPEKRHRVEVSLNPPLDPTFEVNDLGSDFGGLIMTLSVVFFAILSYFIVTLTSSS